MQTLKTLMRNKDWKAMHFISIRQTTHGEKKKGGEGGRKRKQEGKEATADEF